MKWSALVSATFSARGTAGLFSSTNYLYGIRLHGA